MECPVCKTDFPKFKEILMIVDRSFYCYQCCCRLISYPDGKGGCLVEEDRTGKKWKKAAGVARVSGGGKRGRTIR